MYDDDVVRRHAEMIRDDLRERRLVPLAMRARAGDRRHSSGALDLEAPALPAEGAGLDVGGQSQADDLAACSPLTLLAAQGRVARCLDGALESQMVIA